MADALPVLIVLLYFAPTLAAVLRGASWSNLACVNAVFGWTAIGWGLCWYAALAAPRHT